MSRGFFQYVYIILLLDLKNSECENEDKQLREISSAKAFEDSRSCYRINLEQKQISAFGEVLRVRFITSFCFWEEASQQKNARRRFQNRISFLPDIR